MLLLSISSAVFFLYFLFRLATVEPFLPSRSSSTSSHPRRPVSIPDTLLALLCLFVPLSLATSLLVNVPFLLSVLAASIVAIRFVPSAPALSHTSPPSPRFLHIPRLLLWRLDVLLFVLFTLLSPFFFAECSLFHFIVSSILATAAIIITSIDANLRLQANYQPFSFKHFIGVLTAPFPKPDPVTYVPPTVFQASALTLLTFKWASPIISTGYERPLESTDVPPMAQNYSARVASADRFDFYWKKQLQRPRPSVLVALFQAFGLRLLLGGVLKIFNDMCIFLSPMLLGFVIQYLQVRDELNLPLSYGFQLSFGLYFTYLFQTILFQQYFNISSTVEAAVRAALTAHVYSKSCCLSPQSRSLYTSGQIQNLMANDSKTVAETVLYLHMLWSSIEQVILAMTLLVSLLGIIPTIAGVVVIVGALPLQSLLISMIKSLREKASGHTDDRVKVMSETIKGIKLVKLYAWELSFIRKILIHRSKELDKLKSMNIFQAWSTTFFTGLPTILTLVVFTVFVCLGKTLDAAIIFPAIALFNVLRPAMIIFPFILVNCARAAAGLTRLQKFLTAEEIVPLKESSFAMDQDVLENNALDVAASDASFTWNPSDSSSTTLSGVTFSVPEGSLVAVVGSTGCGKSTLLAGILGEVPIVSGKAGVREGRSIAFCDQVPFIQNATVRENIMFGKPFDEQKYRNTIHVCCLEPDLEILPAGDLTEIGGRGVNLSGGQRARVSLARAVYSRSDIYLLDDPLSAVDAHVGASIFKNCISKELGGKTRILTTNQIHFAASVEVDIVIVVREGVMVEVGDRNELVANPESRFSELLHAAGELAEESSDDDAGNGMENGKADEVISPTVDEEHSESLEKASKAAPLNSTAVADYGAAEAGKLTQKETKEKGKVQLKQYEYYLVAMGVRWVVAVIGFSVLNQVFLLLVNTWLSIWSDQSESDGNIDVWFNLLVFIALGVGAISVASLGAFSIAFGSIRASVLLHERLLFSVLGAPSSFFNSTPDGRLLNRFTSDMDKIDQAISSTLQSMNRLIMSLLFTLGVMLWATPLFVFIALPVLAFCLLVQEYYRRTSVDLRRLEALARSPLYSHFSETLDGVVTLRAYGDIARSTHVNNMYTDQLGAAMYASAYANRWLAMRLEGLGTTLLLLASTILVVLVPSNQLSAATAGLVLSYSMTLMGSMTFSVRQFTDMESQMSAVERIREYAEAPFPQEEKGGLGGLLNDLQKSKEHAQSETKGLISKDREKQLNSTLGQRRSRWPRRGKVDFENVVMRYRADLPAALREISFNVKPGEHIGIVGRTGAGKSSAIQCLFRLYELEKGRIVIDGVDISGMRLYELRSCLGVIPQEPMCFSGTIRSNLDMFEEYSNEEVSRALDRCGLQDTMRSEVTLEMEVQENGSNLSVGQRQLLCLGRALLKESQVVVLDEATSNVSNEVDEKIQQTLREEMGHCTVLTVAHRLHTVMRSDRIIVMDRGQVAEVGKPSVLLDGPSMLSDLVDETGPSTAAHLRELSRESDRPCQPLAGEEGDGEDEIACANGASALNKVVNKVGLEGGTESESVREAMTTAMGELRSVLDKMQREDVQREMNTGEQRSWRETLREMVGKVVAVTEGVQFEGHSRDEEAMVAEFMHGTDQLRAMSPRVSRRSFGSE